MPTDAELAVDKLIEEIMRDYGPQDRSLQVQLLMLSLHSQNVGAERFERLFRAKFGASTEGERQ